MKDRNTVLAMFFATVIAEALLLAHSGLLGWVVSRPHTAEEVHGRLFDWRVMLSVGLVTIILWLGYRWLRLGVGEEGRGQSTGKR